MITEIQISIERSSGWATNTKQHWILWRSLEDYFGYSFELRCLIYMNLGRLLIIILIIFCNMIIPIFYMFSYRLRGVVSRCMRWSWKSFRRIHKSTGWFARRPQDPYWASSDSAGSSSFHARSVSHCVISGLSQRKTTNVKFHRSGWNSYIINKFNELIPL